ncbi:MAG: RluA family pseudouridine synthase [Cyanobacteria bacterium J06598_3]
MVQLRYLYSSRCSKTGMLWQLPRTEEAECSAIALMEQLAQTPTLFKGGNLYGVLLAQTTTGEKVVLKGCSGTQHQRPEWVPSLPVSVQMALAESVTLAKLDQLKTELIALGKLPVRVVYDQKNKQYAGQLAQLASNHRERKRDRDRLRTHYTQTLQGAALAQALDALTRESQQASTERRRLKQERDQALAPLLSEIGQADQRIQQLKQHYSTLSLAWQQQMQRAYIAERACVISGRGKGACREDILREGCYQRVGLKLLHHTMAHQLTPLSLAEFWWGAPTGDYVSGQFYGADDEACQALMRLATDPQILEMSSISTDFSAPLLILYEDAFLKVVDKPAGLLSVPGRRYHQQDSVLSRLRYSLPEQSFLQLVHRLDQATSGLLVVATCAEAHAALSQQFAQRQVHKTYEALLSHPIDTASGVIDLPLWPDPENRPRQRVDFQRGKPSKTAYRRLTSGDNPRVELVPYTGRTHQLRVHAAYAKGLNSPILGDGLYGSVKQDLAERGLMEDGWNAQPQRLHLHATRLEFVHPMTGEALCLKSVVPF